MELCRARSYQLGVHRDRSAIQQQAQRLEFLANELDRLCEHPTLFPSRSVQLRFMIISFDYESEYSFFEACKTLMVQKSLLSVQQRSNKLLHCDASHHSSAHGWEGFLLPAEIGRDLIVERTRKNCSLQLLPAVGVRICGDLTREEFSVSDHERELKRLCLRTIDRPSEKTERRCCALEKCENTCRRSMFRDGQRHTRTHALDTVRGTRADSLAQQKFQGIALYPSPFDLNRKLRVDAAMSQGTTPIETFSSIIHRLELLAPRHFISSTALNTPNTLAVVSVQSCNRYMRLYPHQRCIDAVAPPSHRPVTFTAVEC